MRITEQRISDLHPYENNPRKNDSAVDAVAASIKEFGFKVPIVVDRNNVVVTGHTRLKAAKRLGLKTVPTIIADDLTEDQVKAFRLADNKVGEIALWDDDLLKLELDGMFEIDMAGFGFTDKIEREEKRDPKERTYKATNFDKFDWSRCTGRYDMPMLRPVDHKPKRLIGFNYATASADYDAGVHFYLDDYQFERIWNRPDDYMPMLAKFDCCLTPNYSIYLDMPEAIKIWNTYRARLLGQIMQDCGIITIPIVYWSNERSFDYCFDGIPIGGTISVNNYNNKEPEAKKLWYAGMDEIMKRIMPSRILLFTNGSKTDYDFGDVDVVEYENEVTKRLHEWG